MFLGRAITKIESSTPILALTFDDGPSMPWTKEILDLLKQYNVRATFFIVGSCARKYPDIVKDIADAGHVIGNHSYNHEPVWMYSKNKLLRNINLTQKIIYKIIKSYPKFFRPPKGILFSSQKKIIKENNLHTALWSLSSKDWCASNGSRLAKQLIERITPGDIVLFHDGGGTFFNIKESRLPTVDCLRILLPHYKLQGWQFVTLDSYTDIAA